MGISNRNILRAVSLSREQSELRAHYPRLSIKQQGRIVHRNGLNNENNKNLNKKFKKSKIKDFIFNSTNGKS